MKKRIFILSCILIFGGILVWTFLLQNRKEKQSSDLQVMTYSNLTVRNWKDYFKVEGKVLSNQGTLEYEIRFVPLKKEATYADIMLKASLDIRGDYLENNQKKFKRITLLLDQMTEEDGVYIFKGVYSEEQIKFQAPIVKDSYYQSFIKMQEISGSIY